MARAHGIQWRRTEFIEPVPFALGEHFRSEWDFSLHEIPFERSEASVCENLVYPMHREVWKPHRDALTLWSQEPLVLDADLSGVPDYVVSRRSPLGPFVPDQPFFPVVEAKRDDVVRGWGQCLAAMRAAQKLSGLRDGTFFGATASGRAWEFGQISGDRFTQDPRPFPSAEVERVASALNFVVRRCRGQALAEPVLA